jgi:very-short-patch-repair endonuclease
MRFQYSRVHVCFAGKGASEKIHLGRKCLWRMLRSRRLAGYKFRRQYYEGRYYLDFYCLEAKFAVELDGSGHGFPNQQAHDHKRDAFLAERGILVKRIWNHQLVKGEDRQHLVENLWRILQERAPHPENIPPMPYRRRPDKIEPNAPSP